MNREQAIRTVGAALLLAHGLLRAGRTADATAVYSEVREVLDSPIGPEVEAVYAKEIAEYEAEFTKRLLKRNPGMSARARAAYNKEHGTNLKPGVKKFRSYQDLKRWGSWAARFYGRRDTPPLVKNGKPTKLALTAIAWGLKAPTTWREAKKYASMGREILAIYRDVKDEPLDRALLSRLNKMVFARANPVKKEDQDVIFSLFDRGWRPLELSKRLMIQKRVLDSLYEEWSLG